jgi:hypothetical protein
MVKVIGPLAVTQQVGLAHLDLDDDHPALGVDPHKVGAAIGPQRHFGQAPDIVAGKQPANAARHGQRGALFKE